MAERDVGVTRQPARHLGLILGKPRRVRDTGRAGQGGDQPAGDFIGVLQRVIPAFQRGETKAAHHIRLVLCQALQREQRIAVKLNAVIGRVEGFEVEVSFFRQPRQIPGRPGGGIDRLVGEHAQGLAGLDRARFELFRIDPLGTQRGGKLDPDNVAGRKPRHLCLAERGRRAEIAIGAVIHGGAALLKNRRQQEQGQTLRRADHQFRAADGKLGTPFRQLAHRIGRRLPPRRTGLDVDRKPGLRIKPLPQRSVVAGVLELRWTPQL